MYSHSYVLVLHAFLHRDSVLFSFLAIHINKPWSWLVGWMVDESDENNEGGLEQVKLHVRVIYIIARSTNVI